MTNDISPIDAANALTPHWMRKIADFDALEIHSCAVVGRDSSGTEFVEQCEQEQAHFWTVYGHCRSRGLDAYEDFSTEAEAIVFYGRLTTTFSRIEGGTRQRIPAVPGFRPGPARGYEPLRPLGNGRSARIRAVNPHPAMNIFSVK